MNLFHIEISYIDHDGRMTDHTSKVQAETLSGLLAWVVACLLPTYFSDVGQQGSLAYSVGTADLLTIGADGEPISSDTTCTVWASDAAPWQNEAAVAVLG